MDDIQIDLGQEQAELQKTKSLPVVKPYSKKRKVYDPSPVAEDSDEDIVTPQSKFRPRNQLAEQKPAPSVFNAESADLKTLKVDKKRSSN